MQGEVVPSPNEGKPFVRLTGMDVAPNGDWFVTDGYASSNIHVFDKTGKYLKSFGGKKEPYNFSTLHKIAIDTRFDPPRIICCDRENKRVTIGQNAGTITLPDSDTEYVITKAGVATMTLPAPTVAQNGLRLTFTNHNKVPVTIKLVLLLRTRSGNIRRITDTFTVTLTPRCATTITTCRVTRTE